MFIDIDRNKAPQKPRYFLAKPNKEIITNLTWHKYNDSASFKFGGIGELRFTIPYYVDDNFKLVYNKDVDLVREKMLIKMVLGSYKEWFIIDEIEDVGDEGEFMNITAFSLPFELSHKLIPYYQKESVSVRRLLTDMLQDELRPTSWKIGRISPELDNLYRHFDITNSNVMDVIMQAGESFGALVDWDTENREVSFLSLGEGKYKGLSVNYGRLLKSLSRDRTTDEMVTRLYVYGNEDLSINNVNPTGQSYIEDFSYFMYPFEQDKNGNVIKSSYFMSDDLCKALINHSKLVEDYTPQYRELIEERKTLTNARVTKETQRAQLILERDNIEARLDMAKATEDYKLIEVIKIELSNKNREIDDISSEIDNLLVNINNINNQINHLTNQLRKESNFTPDLLDELNLYVIEKEFRDDRYINEEELYEDALKKFKELREPKVAVTVNIDNLFNIVEEQYYWDKLTLGDLIKIKYPQMNMEYMARVIEIDFDFSNDNISVTIANAEKADSMDKLKELLSTTKTATSILESNKYKWDKVNEINDEVYRLINSEIDATKNKIIAGINNEIEVGRRGIIIKNPDYPNEVVIMQSGVIALSEDGGETWYTAIKPSGIIAERLIGNIIVGRNLIITNGDNSFVFDNEGMKVDANKFVVTSSTSEQPFQDIISEFESKIEVTKNKISLIVSEDNKIKGEQLVSAINMQPENIKISSKNVDITGLVTYETLDSSVKDKLDFSYNLTVDWRYPNKTTINGGLIETNTIGASKIKTDELIVGENIQMSPKATINWNQVNDKPFIPSKASDIGAKPSSYSAYDDIGWNRLTQITANGVYTGIVQANQIQAGTIYGLTISGGSITSNSTINVTTDVYVGNNIYLGYKSDQESVKSIILNSDARIQTAEGIAGIKVSSSEFYVQSSHISMGYPTSNIYINGNVTINGNHNIVAKFG